MGFLTGITEVGDFPFAFCSVELGTSNGGGTAELGATGSNSLFKVAYYRSWRAISFGETEVRGTEVVLPGNLSGLSGIEVTADVWFLFKKNGVESRECEFRSCGASGYSGTNHCDSRSAVWLEHTVPFEFHRALTGRCVLCNLCIQQNTFLSML